MNLPSPREVELEAALRERDAQVSQLAKELSWLRQQPAAQPELQTSTSAMLPSALMTMLLPYISNASKGATPTAGSSTVNAALTQRVQLLQDENNELYDLLRHGETGRLKEEVQGLRHVVTKLETALRESHSVITSLSSELEKTYETFQRRTAPTTHAYTSSRESYHGPSHSAIVNANGQTKLPPTGPRAHKKPRLSDPRVSPTHSSAPTSRPVERDLSRSPRVDSRSKISHGKMDVDEDARTRPRSPTDRGSDRYREKNRTRERERERDKDRDRDRFSRRNGGGGSGGGSGGNSRRARGHGATGAHAYGTSAHDRTLAERMGL
ncbi:hypothetical protein CONPUDRAFT_164736 [Coniophora puteana RWD-64-598 SS2]|uniref:Uncharacterized protein n=1 Tax=Coniophora puteana (strain RWD-64-598) TaxID=741705 RepID=A0A5M3MSE9_CONPW|nr:uncharacterized protein CONPUDRAFT_164736 [Coniophora puteana RWD-64-598 SS2]EIW82089.1 hypothetical protein CONPUDRAFT_164736 [Coniophora puteana RWD-64-598 SS2]